MERFQASTQYGDWRGSAAADDAAMDDLSAALASRGIVPAGRFLVGFDLWQSEVDGATHLKAYLANGQSFDEAAGLLPPEGPVDLTVVDIPLTLADFLACFKRFNIKMVRSSLNLHGREYREG